MEFIHVLCKFHVHSNLSARKNDIIFFKREDMYNFMEPIFTSIFTGCSLIISIQWNLIITLYNPFYLSSWKSSMSLFRIKMYLILGLIVGNREAVGHLDGMLVNSAWKDKRESNQYYISGVIVSNLCSSMDMVVQQSWPTTNYSCVLPKTYATNPSGVLKFTFSWWKRRHFLHIHHTGLVSSNCIN